MVLILYYVFQEFKIFHQKECAKLVVSWVLTQSKETALLYLLYYVVLSTSVTWFKEEMKKDLGLSPTKHDPKVGFL